MISIFNLGEPDDYRVPDGGVFRPGPDAVYVPTAAVVVEIVAPGDKTWEKLGFYGEHGVEELLIVDPQERRVHWLALQPNGTSASAGPISPVRGSGRVSHHGSSDAFEDASNGRTFEAVGARPEPLRQRLTVYEHDPVAVNDASRERRPEHDDRRHPRPHVHRLLDLVMESA